jgi:hypothetical protein
MARDRLDTTADTGNEMKHTQNDAEAESALLFAFENAKSKDQLACLISDFLWMKGKGPSTPEMKDEARERQDALVEAAFVIARNWATMGDLGRLVIAALRLGRRLP